MTTTPSFKEDHISQLPALQLLINLGYKYLTPKEALELRDNKKANIILNRNLLPYDIAEGRHYQNPGGLRIGTSEITRLGMGKSEMVDIAEFFRKLLIEKKDPKIIKNEVAEFKKEFQEIKYCFQSSNKAYEFMKFY